MYFFSPPYVLRAFLACPMHISMYILWLILHVSISARSRALSPCLEKPSTLARRVPLLAPGPSNVGVSTVKLYLASGSYFRAMSILNPILLTLQMGHLDGLMTNQPMITHNCGVMHLVFLIFGGGELGITQLGQVWPRSSQIICSWAYPSSFIRIAQP